MSERKLASIQRIVRIYPALNSENLELAQVLGWQVVIGKNSFKEGELVVFCEVDSVLPPRDVFKFLESKHYRIKTIKLRGNLSQGIVFPLTILSSMPHFIE